MQDDDHRDAGSDRGETRGDSQIRRERRRIIGAELTSAPLDADEVSVLDASASDVVDAIR